MKDRKSYLERALNKVGRLIATRLLSRRLFQPFNTMLLYIAYYGLGVHNQLTGDPTPNERNFLQRLNNRLSGKSTKIIDVGANEGQYVSYLRSVFTNSDITSFEPNPVSYNRLVENTKDLDITTVNKACSDSNGEALMFDFEDKPGSASASMSPDIIEFAGHKAKEIPIETVRLDQYLSENGIEHVDFLKVDAEGFDLGVLKGARSFIEDKKIDVIQFEFARISAVNRILMADFFDLLTGYDIYRLAGNGDLLPLGEYEPLTAELFGHQNLIAVNPTFEL